MAKESICSIPECGKPVKGHGLCENHRYRLQKHGDPLGGRTQNGEPMRFALDAASIRNRTECILWPYNKNSAGYGMVYGKLAHRIVCEIAHGPAPTSKHEGAHLCGNGHSGCINPDHLSWKTRKENEDDKLAHGTRLNGDRHPQAKLTEDQAREILSLKGKVPKTKIAAKFGISYGAVRDIHKRRRWAHLK